MARLRWHSSDYSITFRYVLAEPTATVGRARTADAGHAMSGCHQQEEGLLPQQASFLVP